MYEAGKLANTIHEMDRLKISILGISETWWPGAGECNTENKRFYYSGNNDRDHRRGVGVIVTKEIAGSVTDFVPYSDRTMLLKIRTKPLNINIIQVYAPTLDRGDDEMDKFYGEIKELLGLTKPHEINIIQGDFNAKIGSLQADQIVGPYGLGDRNHRGDRLVQFCQEENFKITNTWFSLPPRRLYTWRSPQDNKDNIVRNQIDFILINRRFGTSLKRVCTYPGADVPSDHVLLLASYKVKLSLVKRQQRKPQLAIEKLKNEEVRTTLQQKLNDGLARLRETIGEYQVDNIWDSLKKTMNSVSQNILGYRQSVPKNKWMTEEILRLMDERRKHKNVNPDQYSLLNSRIRSEIRKAKRKWLEQECQEIERLQQIHDTHREHKKLKEVAGIYKTKAPIVLVNDKNEIILEKDERRRMWEQYIRKLFQDSERTDLEINPAGESLSGPPITKEEIRKAIQLSKNNKAVGPDEVPAEIIKLIDDDNLSLLEVVFNKIYSTGSWVLATCIKSMQILGSIKTTVFKCRCPHTTQKEGGVLELSTRGSVFGLTSRRAFDPYYFALSRFCSSLITKRKNNEIRPRESAAFTAPRPTSSSPRRPLT
ncbi:uncharacterized protein LOC132705128 [Cylas formicarius]|uniref:uncharacterized protein LOC132705128 n=1 Tax=Cylas formicarius TaxID=197179 RepID=UPI0029584C18|nr:uncharacterized protein LOC132705128 [Cylas formicarius]